MESKSSPCLLPHPIANRQDPSTGIQPFLPLASPSSPLTLILAPLSLIVAVARALILLSLLVLYFVLGTLAAPIRPLSNLVTWICARGALATLGWYWIDQEVALAKRSKKGAVYTPPSPRRGDLIIANWTSWVDVLILSYM